MPVPELAPNEKYTYRDYVTWPDDERWEIIDGVAYNMSPAPGTAHQQISAKLTAQFVIALEGKPCRVFAAPCDVVLSDEDIVQPDLLVVCDENKITEKNVQGAPDLVIEILSESTAHKDRTVKKVLYEKYGVGEYCIVDPVWKCVHRFALNEDGRYGAEDYFDSQSELNSTVLPELTILLKAVFGEPKKQETGDVKPPPRKIPQSPTQSPSQSK